MTPSDEHFMRRAIELAENGRWHAAPNPTVGAVLVRGGAIVAEGWHAVFGQGHAEVNCLADARARGVDPAGCTLYVTLEPCNHYGKTPPCSKAVAAAGIRRVVIGMPDVNKSASGGAEFLRSAGVEVESGVLENECRRLAADFIVWQTEHRPWVILKMAVTLDGRIAPRGGRSVPVSGESSHGEVMKLRSCVGLAGGAVMVGGGTFRSDDPLLTARGVAAGRQPAAVVMTSSLSEEFLESRLMRQRPGETVFITTHAQSSSNAAGMLRTAGARVHGVDSVDGGLSCIQTLRLLWDKEHCSYVLCEGGGLLGTSLVENGLADELRLHVAPVAFGDEGAPSLFSGRRVPSMSEALRFETVSVRQCGGDAHIVLRPARS